MNECKTNEKKPVLFYKKQGVDMEGSDLNAEYFCIILMNSAQSEMLKKFGGNIVCVDSTHGLNSYDFEMTTVLVIDEFYEGFPVATMFSNRKDTHIHEIFFGKIKERTGQIEANVFMTDITNIFYSAWVSTMGAVPHQLYCSWHVDRAWQQNLNKVNDSEKKEVDLQNLEVFTSYFRKK